MQCPQCLSHNYTSASYCDQCGAPIDLNARSAARGPRRWLVVLLVVTVVIGLANLFGVLPWMGSRDDGRGAGGDGLQKQNNAGQNSKARESAQRDKSVDATSKPADGADADRARVKLSSGWLVVEDSWGRRLASLPLAVAADGWLAAPRRFLIGGTKWKLEIEGRVDALENGLYRVGMQRSATGGRAAHRERARHCRNSKCGWRRSRVRRVPTHAESMLVRPLSRVARDISARGYGHDVGRSVMVRSSVAFLINTDPARRLLGSIADRP